MAKGIANFKSVQDNNNKENHEDPIYTLRILDEVADGRSITQRYLSNKLGIGLGMVNSYLKRLVQQGYITITQAERKRLQYFLTPKGIAEKSVLTYRYIKTSYQVFTDARSRIEDFFRNLEKEGVKSVVLYKATVIADISLLALQDNSLDLVAIVDEKEVGRRFLGYRVQPVEALRLLSFDKLLITTEEPAEKVAEYLAQYGIRAENICSLQ